MRARASVAALAASLALLTGCGDGGDEPGADPTPIIPSSSSSEPSPSESEAAEEEPPEMPEAAREESTAGGRAFVRHWIGTFNYAARTGDADSLDVISNPGCGSCDNFVERIQGIYEDGGTYESSGWKILTVGSGSEEFQDPSISARIAVPRERYVYRNPREVEVLDPQKITVVFDLLWRQGGWTAGDITVL